MDSLERLEQKEEGDGPGNAPGDAVVAEIIPVLDRLQQLLTEEGVDYAADSIHHVSKALSEEARQTGGDPDRKSALATSLAEAGARYKKLLGGMGSFADLTLWRDDYDDRRRLNEELDNLRDTATRLLVNRPAAQERRGQSHDAAD